MSQIYTPSSQIGSPLAALFPGWGNGCFPAQKSAQAGKPTTDVQLSAGVCHCWDWGDRLCKGVRCSRTFATWVLCRGAGGHGGMAPGGVVRPQKRQ